MVESNFYLLFTIYRLPALAVTSRLRQVVVNHPAAVFPRLRRRRVAAFLVAADLVLGVETFEDELAGGDEHGVVRAFEVEGDDGVLDRSEEHTSELQSRFGISYAVFCLKKKKNN